MNKPAFNPDQPFEVAGKPPFNPNQSFKAVESKTPFYQKAADAINSTKASIGKLLSPITRPASVALQGYNESNQGSPTQLLQSVPGLLNRGADILGNKINESLSSQGIQMAPGTGTKPLPVSPLIAAGAGTFAKVSPDVIMSTVNPASGESNIARAGLMESKVAPVVERALPAAEKTNLLPAIRLRNETYVGAPNEIHADVINQMANKLGQNPDDIIDAVKKIGDEGFTNNGQFLSREETRALTGSRPEAASLIAQGKMGPNVPAEIPKTITPPKISPPSNPITKIQDTYAVDKALSAMGTPKRLLKDPVLLNKAQNHAQVLLDNGLIAPLQSTKAMAEKLGELEAQSGQKIGSILDTLGEQGKVFDLQSNIKEFNQLRPISKSTGQILRGGAYDKINGKIDDAIATVQAHLPKTANGVMNQPISFQEANDLKGVLQDLANYSSNKDATILDKVIAGKFRESLDNSLEQASNQIGDPRLAQEFQQAKKLYGATQFAKDPIYNKISSELTNKKLSLTDWIVGSHSIASGNPLTAVAEVALKKGFEKYGAGTQAFISNKLSKTPKLIGTSNKAYGASLLLRKREKK